MAVRTLAIRTLPGFLKLRKITLVALALAGSMTAQPVQAAPGSWENNGPPSVLVQPNTNLMKGVSSRKQSEQDIPVEQIPIGSPVAEPFDSDVQTEGLIISGPEASDGYPTGSEAGTSYDTYANGYQGGDGDGEPGQLQCGPDGCYTNSSGGCPHCQSGGCEDPVWSYNANCEPAGLFQKLWCLCRQLESDGGWTGRVDALILSRNAPSNRPLYTFNPATAGTALNANQLESIAAVGPRLSIFHGDKCRKSWEGTYIYSGGFVADKSLIRTAGGYLTAPPGIYGNDSPPINNLDTASARLTSSLQSAELNRRWAIGPCSQFLAGFRWLNWQESLSITDAYAINDPANAGQDLYNTNTFNNLYGGQIGLDTLLWAPSKHFHLEGLVKAGAYYNSASQSSAIQQLQGGVPYYTSAVNVGRSPATCAFVGELGMTGVVSINRNLDFRFGYFGLWLTSLAQPSNQLSGQTLTQALPALGSLTTNGNVVLQGLSLGLEGRW